LTAGEITSTEIAPMLIGGLLGTAIWPRVYGWQETRLRTTEIAEEKLVPKEIRIGEKKFVEQRLMKRKALMQECISRFLKKNM